MSRCRERYNSEGPWNLTRISLLFLKEVCITNIPNHVLCWYHRIFNQMIFLNFRVLHITIFSMHTVRTWRNERTVAVPIWNLVRRFEEQNKKILEVGNVLSYYFKVNHDILDKYEIMDGVINEDVVDFRPSKQYDLIVSIVTLEHVGWSESSKEPAKIIRAFEENY